MNDDINMKGAIKMRFSRHGIALGGVTYQEEGLSDRFY